MRMVSVYVEAGIAKAQVEEWNGEGRRRKKSYRLSAASLDRLADIVNTWLREGRVWVRPFLGGCIGYVAEESTNDLSN